MLIEIVTHTAIPGNLDAFLGHFGEQLRPVATDAGAELLLLSTGATGPLNQAIVAWRYDSLAHHAQAQERLCASDSWRAARSKGARMLLREHTQLVRCTPFTTVTLPPAGTRLVDLRTYSFQPGGLEQFLPICQADGLPRQRMHCGNLVFHGVSASGRMHQLVQAWAYASHEQYDAGQKALFKDADWARGYRERVIHLVQEQEHQHLRPLAGSPFA